MVTGDGGRGGNPPVPLPAASPLVAAPFWWEVRPSRLFSVVRIRRRAPSARRLRIPEGAARLGGCYGGQRRIEKVELRARPSTDPERGGCPERRAGLHRDAVAQQFGGELVGVPADLDEHEVRHAP